MFGLESILARTEAEILITGVEEEERHSPTYPEIGTRVLILGGHPYTGYVVSGTIGFLQIKVKTKEQFQVGESLRFSELWGKRDKSEYFSLG